MTIQAGNLMIPSTAVGRIWKHLCRRFMMTSLSVLSDEKPEPLYSGVRICCKSVNKEGRQQVGNRINDSLGYDICPTDKQDAHAHLMLVEAERQHPEVDQSLCQGRSRSFGDSHAQFQLCYGEKGTAHMGDRKQRRLRFSQHMRLSSRKQAPP